MDHIGRVGESFRRRRDVSQGKFTACQQKYTRLYGQQEQALRRAYNVMDAAESRLRTAHARYESSMRQADNVQNDSDRQAALQRAQQLKSEEAAAEKQLELAAKKYQQAQEKMNSLVAIWEKHAPSADAARRQIEDHFSAFSIISGRGNQDLGQYMGLMVKAQNTLFQGAAPSGSVGGGASGTAGSSAAGSGAPLPAGWCSKNSMSAISMDASGRKSVTMEIGGEKYSFPCTKAGMARAYRAACRSNDQDMISRTSAMFEIENLREDLELGAGDPGMPQLGGYHRDVQAQDPAGFESHHIPARSVQDVDAGWLPSLSISCEDHKNTSSYSGKQRHVYHSIIPGSPPGVSYKESITQNLKQGGCGYISSVRNELYDLRIQTGHTYDGGVSGMLDAVIDMLSTRGIPGAKR